MNPGLFITIVFSSFVFLLGVAGALIVTVTVVRGRSSRRCESQSSRRRGGCAFSAQPVGAPGRTLHPEGRRRDVAAAELVISSKTVERYRQNILDKLGMSDRVEFTRHAIRRGLQP